MGTKNEQDIETSSSGNHPGVGKRRFAPSAFATMILLLGASAQLGVATAPVAAAAAGDDDWDRCMGFPNIVAAAAYVVAGDEIVSFNEDTTIRAGTINVSGRIENIGMVADGSGTLRGADLCFIAEQIIFHPDSAVFTKGGMGHPALFNTDDEETLVGSAGGRGGDILFISEDDPLTPDAPQFTLSAGSTVNTGSGGAGQTVIMMPPSFSTIGPGNVPAGQVAPCSQWLPGGTISGQGGSGGNSGAILINSPTTGTTIASATLNLGSGGTGGGALVYTPATGAQGIALGGTGGSTPAGWSGGTLPFVRYVAATAGNGGNAAQSLACGIVDDMVFCFTLQQSLDCLRIVGPPGPGDVAPGGPGGMGSKGADGDDGMWKVVPSFPPSVQCEVVQDATEGKDGGGGSPGTGGSAFGGPGGWGWLKGGRGGDAEASGGPGGPGGPGGRGGNGGDDNIGICPPMSCEDGGAGGAGGPSGSPSATGGPGGEGKLGWGGDGGDALTQGANGGTGGPGGPGGIIRNMGGADPQCEGGCGGQGGTTSGHSEAGGVPGPGPIANGLSGVSDNEGPASGTQAPPGPPGPKVDSHCPLPSL